MSDVPASHDGALESTADGGVIRFARHLPYPIRNVWDVITNQARLADWWLPFDADITVELREGGEMVFAGRGEEPVTITCTILRIEPPLSPGIEMASPRRRRTTPASASHRR